MTFHVPPLREQVYEYSDIIGPKSISLSQLADLLETASQGLCIVDRLYHVVACNDEFTQMVGASFEDLHGVRLPAIFANPADLTRVLSGVWSSGEWDGELDLYPSENTRVPVYMRGKTVPGEALDLAVLFFRDLLEREISAASSQRERLVREAFFDAVSEGLFRFKLDRPLATDWPEDLQREHVFIEARLTRSNEAGARQFGRSSPMEIQDVPLRELLPSVGYEIADRFVRADFKLKGERIRIDCGSEERYFHLNVIGLDRGSGTIEEIWTSAVEVTVQVEREASFARRLEERKQGIARKLHDEVSPYLTGARIFAERLSEEFDRDHLDLLKDYLENARDHVARVHRDLRPPDEGEPLGQIAADLVGQHDAFGEVDFSFEGDYSAGSLEQEATAHLYRIVQEGLRNAARHSRADRVVVRIEETEDELSIEISDDGVGFDPEDVSRSSGLQNMEYRADAVGAELEISSAAGSGTTIRCVLGLPE